MPLFIPSVKTNFSDEIDVSSDMWVLNGHFSVKIFPDNVHSAAFMFQIINLNDWI